MSERMLGIYCEAVHRKGAALDNCWGFVDGPVRPICRPGKYQRQVYNGHKRVHALKYQSVVAANGLIVHMHGPVEGKRHDARIFVESGLQEQLQLHSYDEDNRSLCIYGDGSYPVSRHV
ncbi:Hypothetical predicted protein [Paramuricea clavata]|uniref:Uncharacterized protein n=1 Tax=Paramuricea clavata TaxID=317549 RepID=A0A6S7G1A3_PARCT|nr:Hypothetical predicted protein [Paramuricea clavata]